MPDNPHEKPQGPTPGSPTRREVFQTGSLLALPALFGAMEARAEGPLTPGPRVYQSIGVEPVINCRGTFTIIGGSVELPEVRAAMDAASHCRGRGLVRLSASARMAPRTSPGCLSRAIGRS